MTVLWQCVCGDPDLSQTLCAVNVQPLTLSHTSMWTSLIHNQSLLACLHHPVDLKRETRSERVHRATKASRGTETRSAGLRCELFCTWQLDIARLLSKAQTASRLRRQRKQPSSLIANSSVRSKAHFASATEEPRHVRARRNLQPPVGRCIVVTRMIPWSLHLVKADPL